MGSVRHENIGDRMVKVFLPPYEHPPPWRPPNEIEGHPDYDSDLRQFLPRIVKFKRNRYNDQLGFNIRGGKEHRCGIYVSKVYQGSNAERIGIQVGDKLISVNGHNFEDLPHDDAVRILKSSNEIEMKIKYFPYGFEKTFERSYITSPGASNNGGFFYD
ncbi:PDZ domain-containing protein 11-like [Ptychodera flava]|uniref:PDZ domain-containing protein 11-like n=1 Tax=Ptychodera flava TaxID=63121 RepID=UPI00396A73F8